MVLESLAASILDRYLGQYVSGFSKENLKFSVASGEAKLENLVLKKEALEELELPVTVKAGTIWIFRCGFLYVNFKFDHFLIIRNTVTTFRVSWKTYIKYTLATIEK